MIGATSGLGLWTAHYLLKTRHEVIVVARNLDKLKSHFNPDKFNQIIHLDLEERIKNFEKDGKKKDLDNPFN